MFPPEDGVIRETARNDNHDRGGGCACAAGMLKKRNKNKYL
jgi:hypothetical protein